MICTNFKYWKVGKKKSFEKYIKFPNFFSLRNVRLTSVFFFDRERNTDFVFDFFDPKQ